MTTVSLSEQLRALVDEHDFEPVLIALGAIAREKYEASFALGVVVPPIPSEDPDTSDARPVPLR